MAVTNAPHYPAGPIALKMAVSIAALYLAPEEPA